MDYLLASVSDPGDLVQTSSWSSSKVGGEPDEYAKRKFEIQIPTTEVSTGLNEQIARYVLLRALLTILCLPAESQIRIS